MSSTRPGRPAPGLPAGPGRRRPAGTARWAVALVAVALVASACGGSDDGPDDTVPVAPASDRSPVTADELPGFLLDPAHMAGPGTPLGGGLSVPEGARLLGVPFPDLTGGGYRAQLLLVGDPVTVFNAMGAQASGLGMQRTGGCLGVEASVGCSGRFVDAADGESLVVEVTRRVTDAGIVSGMGVRYRPPGSDEQPRDETSSAPTAPLPQVDLPPAVGPPADEDVGRALRVPGSPPREVEIGSELVGLPGPCGCGEPGWSFVVVVEGVVRDVLAAYARQFTDLGDPPDLSDRIRDEATVFGVRVGDEGEPRAEVRAVALDAGPTYAIVTVIGT